MTTTSSPRLISALTVFALVFPIIYVVSYYNELAIVRFYPMVGELHLNIQPTTFGPAMIYYSWVVISAVFALIVGFAVPPRWTAYLWSGWIWVVPVAATLFTFVYETRWLMH